MKNQRIHHTHTLTNTYRLHARNEYIFFFLNNNKLYSFIRRRELTRTTVYELAGTVKFKNHDHGVAGNSHTGNTDTIIILLFDLTRRIHKKKKNTIINNNRVNRRRRRRTRSSRRR